MPYSAVLRARPVELAARCPSDVTPFSALIWAMHGTREGRVGPVVGHVISHSALIRAMLEGGME
eukprot:952982-Alexandrium_andersonii.AAC.1